MEKPGQATLHGELSTKISGKKNIDIPPPLSLDEDDSSLSSAGTEVFDLNSSESSQKIRWQLDANGKFQRYGSSESATSTGLSSICSSIAADELALDKSTPPTPSRKRMLDGSMKTSPPILDSALSKAVTVAATATETVSATGSPNVSQIFPQIPKKRGRPPKVRPINVETSSQSPTVAAPNQLRRAVGRPPKAPRIEGQARPRSSIPSRLPADVFASQCVEAARDSRLDPYALHPGEQRLLGNLLMSKEITVYLNIRNTMLRLWHQNPICSVTPEEAAGCAKESRFFGIAELAYKWLTRNGYINFGCVEVQGPPIPPKRFGKDVKQRTVIVIGAGVSGLTTARQLESLFRQEAATWINLGERPPRVIVLEGRKRIGGRVYSKPLRSQVRGSLPDGLRNTAEMGAMIVTGFEYGNPLDTVIRGQLGLRYHLMKDALTIYDCDGKPVKEERDRRNTELYTDISDRAGEFRAQSYKPETLRGDEELINRCRDPAPDGYSAFQLEPLTEAHVKAHKPATRRGRRRNAPPGVEKLTGRSEVSEGGSATISASRAAKNIGWRMKEGVARSQNISLQRVASASAYPTLGAVMDDAITQYQELVDISAKDMQLLNWHHANLEYANAAPVSQLSLSGHDQDTGNEFEGAHSEVIGGYTQVPRGLMNLPTKLDVRFDHIVESVHYDDHKIHDEPITTKIVCTNGEVFDADEVVLTAPLGVLKADTIDFDPPLPGWKQGAIDRMGFGLLNKVILLYDAPFWDDRRDMFGLLNEAELKASLDPSDYERRRGRFYLIWNATRTSGRPMLVALMAGNAAHDAEWTDTDTLLAEVTQRLRSVFTTQKVPAPLEVIVTRWRRDPFTRGTYSYVGPETRPGDYDLMARSVGNVHFAGEATCGTHPATVHGAFLSGLRAASLVMDSMAGEIIVPNPLVAPAPFKQEIPTPYSSTSRTFSLSQSSVDTSGTISWGSITVPSTTPMPAHSNSPIIKQEEATPPLATSPWTVSKPSGPPAKSVCSTDPSFWVSPAAHDSRALDYEAAIARAILAALGDRPQKARRPGVNPFLLFTKAKWDTVKAHCAATHAPAGRDAIRHTIGQWWRAASDDEKRPYRVQSQEAQDRADALRREWEESVRVYDEAARRIRREYVREHPPPERKGKGEGPVEGGGNGVSRRRTNVSSCVVLDHL